MRAVRFHQHGDPSVLQVEDLPQPTPAERLVLLRVAAAGVNYADVARRQGLYREPSPLPYPVGIEASGTVVALGPGVTGLQEGQRVTGFVRGAYADYALAHPRGLYPIPDGISFEQAAALPVQGLTAYHVLRTAGRLQPGETVLIHAAAGGVGLLAVQLAKLLGAGEVFGTASTEEKRALASARGADAMIDYSREDFVERINALTGGKGVDVILEAVGGDVLTRSLAALAPFGRLVNYGRASGHNDPLDVREIAARNLTLTGFDLTGLLQRRGLAEESMRVLFDYVASGKLDLLVHPYPLDDAAAVHRLLEGRQTTGKLVLVPR